jgi:hypothetical protein
MVRTYTRIALVGAALAAAIATSLPPFRLEASGWSRPGPRYNPLKPNGSLAGRTHRNEREIARRRRQAARHASN